MVAVGDIQRAVIDVDKARDCGSRTINGGGTARVLGQCACTPRVVQRARIGDRARDRAVVVKRAAVGQIARERAVVDTPARAGVGYVANQRTTIVNIEHTIRCNVYTATRELVAVGDIQRAVIDVDKARDCGSRTINGGGTARVLGQCAADCSQKVNIRAGCIDGNVTDDCSGEVHRAFAANREPV